MTKKNSAGMVRYIVKIFTIIPALFSLTTQLLAEAREEAQRMRKKFIALTICTVISFVLLLSVWFSLLGLLMVYLASLELSLMLIFGITFVFNLLLLIIVGLIAMRLKVDPTFPDTRSIIRELIQG